MPELITGRKNILVTGGAGFIGSHLCDKLVRENHVICVDNFLSGSQANISHLLGFPNFVFLKHDMTQPLDLEKYPELEKFKVKFQGIQEIYHLACPTSPKDFDKYRVETLLANSEAVKIALDLTVKYKAKFLFTSSSVVYGPRQKNSPSFREDYHGDVDFLSRRACYDEGKRFAETIISTYKSIYGIEAKTARVFRTYGPRLKLNEGNMIYDFIADALQNKDLAIFGDKDFSSALCYIDDIVEGLIKLMSLKKDIGPVNLGSDIEHKLVDVAKGIIEMTKSKSSVVFREALLFMTPLGLPDLTKAKEEMGWLPIIGLPEGLKKTIDYAKAARGVLGV